MRNFGKEQSAEDVLRQQMQKQEYIDDGGSGGSGPGGGSGGSGGNGESEDESLSGILDELLQVILAAIGFVFLVHTHTHTLSLSLSHTHTRARARTYTHPHTPQHRHPRSPVTKRYLSNLKTNMLELGGVRITKGRHSEGGYCYF